jgi:hypothetical protein
MGSRKLWLSVAVLGFGMAAFGQTSQLVSQSPSPSTAGTCQSVFTSGSGLTLLQFCVTVNGNITEFHGPAGWEHIAVGVPGQEGYGVCDNDTKVRYFDYTSDSGNWLNAVITQPGGPNTFPFKITRASSDGVFTLTQVFSRYPSERIAKISMTLKNNTGSSKTFILVRFANVNANNSNLGTNVNNEFDSGGDSAWAYNLGLFGVRLSTVPTSLEHAAFVDMTNDGPDPCSPGSSSPPKHPFYGDGGVVMAYVLAMPAGQSKTVSVEYKRF